MHPVAQSIVTALAAHADSARAEGMVAYMRGKFAFFGIQTSVRRALTRPFIRAAQPADEFWRSPRTCGRSRSGSASTWAVILLAASGGCWMRPTCRR